MKKFLMEWLKYSFSLVKRSQNQKKRIILSLVSTSLNQRTRSFLKIFAIFLIFSLNSFALSPEEHLPNDSQEQRARNLFLEVRCLVCEGQVIESSDTEFSFEMRKLIRKKVSEGKSDEEIRNDLTKEFGDDILISTSLSRKNNIILWILPILFAAFLFFAIKKSVPKHYL